MPDVTEIPPLGHQDPAWRPDGKQLFYVRNGREGAKGAPIIYRWDVAKKTSPAVTGPGYLEPSFSPDGKYIAATRINAFGSDVVILDAVRGRELLRLTTDGASWAPTWSPKGDAIAFFHIDGQIVDLKDGRPGRQGPELDGRRDEGPHQRVRAWTARRGPTGSSPPTSSRRRPRRPCRRRRPRRPAPRDGRLPRTTGGPVRGRSARCSAWASTPTPTALPDGFSRDLAGIEAFARLIVEAAAPYAAAVKPNLAFFEAYGSAGIAALERIRAAIPSDVLLVADAKRGDIGSDRRPPGRRPVRWPGRRRGDRQPVPRLRGGRRP